MGLPSVAAKPVEWAVGLRIDADWEQLDALRHTDQLTLPTLLFHGTEDDVVPIETSDEFAAALPESVTYHRVPAAGHIQSWNVDPTLYATRVEAFLRRTVGSAAPAGERPAGSPDGASSGAEPAPGGAPGAAPPGTDISTADSQFGE